MTDFNFSTTFGSQSLDQPAGPLWSFNGVRMLAGPAGSVVLHKLRGDKRLLVQPDVAEALRLCGPFRTLEAHARNILEVSPVLKEHADHTRQTLQSLAESGMFESSDDCWSRLTQSSLSSHGDMPCRVFVLTCDRPAALDRLLSGLREFPLPPAVEGIWIIDDSREPESVEENASIIEAQSEGAKVPVVHVDLAIREDLIQHLKTALPECKRSVDWLLERSAWGTQPTYGLARNLALLLSVGKRALVLDDDIIPQAVNPPSAGTGLRFGTANDREAVFYGSRELLTQHALPLAESPLGIMLASLGQPLAALLQRHLSGHEALAGMDGELLDRHGVGSHARMTQCGSWGDSGTADGNWIVNLPAASIQKLIEQGEDLQALVSARSLWFGYRGPMLSDYGTMSQMTGLDHSVTLPPYLPAGRGEDRLFGIMLQRLHPESGVWNEGWAIRHEPLEERAQRGELTPQSVQPGLPLLADWLGREPRDQWGLPAEQRLAGMAQQIRRLAIMDTAALESLLQQELVSKRSLLLRRCMAQLQEVDSISDLPGAPAWHAFLEQSRDQLVSELQTPDPTPLRAAGKERDDETYLTNLRDHGIQFAEALESWPALCEAAGSFNH
jgi:hypothetical protein